MGAKAVRCRFSQNFIFVRAAVLIVQTVCMPCAELGVCQTRGSQYACTLVRCTLYVERSTLLGQFSTCLQYGAVRSVCLSALLLLLGCVLAQGWLFKSGFHVRKGLLQHVACL